MRAPQAPNKINRNPLIAPRLRGICSLPPRASTRVSLMFASSGRRSNTRCDADVTAPRTGDSGHSVHSELTANNGINLALLTYFSLGATSRRQFLRFAEDF